MGNDERFADAASPQSGMWHRIGVLQTSRRELSHIATAAFIHYLPAEAISNAAGDSNYVRVQVLTPVGVLDREKQLGVVRELTEIVAAAANDPSLTNRTWVLITESPEGEWGINGHANTGADIVAAARNELAGLAKQPSG